MVGSILGLESNDKVKFQINICQNFERTWVNLDLDFEDEERIRCKIGAPKCFREVENDGCTIALMKDRAIIFYQI